MDASTTFLPSMTRLDFHFLHRHVARQLVGQQRADFMHKLAKALGAGVFAAHQRELVLHQGVVDQVDVAGHGGLLEGWQRNTEGMTDGCCEEL
jgi:hypothetical protein